VRPQLGAKRVPRMVRGAGSKHVGGHSAPSILRAEVPNGQRNQLACRPCFTTGKL
jgi:hypothetical protein